jgi:hypothetical protein
MQTHPEPLLPFSVPSAVPPRIELELDWFFEQSAPRPTAPALPALPDDPDRIWERIALRVVGGWVRALDAYDADVLRCAFAPQAATPLPFARRLGRLSPLVARLASGEPGWPDAIHWRVVKHHSRTAHELLRAAVRAYARERGRVPCMVYRMT